MSDSRAYETDGKITNSPVAREPLFPGPKDWVGAVVVRISRSVVGGGDGGRIAHFHSTDTRQLTFPSREDGPEAAL